MRQPTKMPQWLHKQFENAEKTVQTWSVKEFGDPYFEKEKNER
jgi:hypothetical protein